MRDQILESPEIQGSSRAEEQDQFHSDSDRREGKLPTAAEHAAVERLDWQPERCIHIGDRESDIYEMFAQAADLKTGFRVRTCSDRLVGDGYHTISDEMADVRVQGLPSHPNDRIEELLPHRWQKPAA